MKVEKTDKPVIQKQIPGCKSENPQMIETVGMPVGSPHGPEHKVKAGPAPSDISKSKPPVAHPA